MYTRTEFESLRREWANELSQDENLKKDALDVFARADRHNWIHQTSWFGEPSLQTSQDLLAFAEIIFKTRPKFIVEIGVAWAGSMLFYATIAEALRLDTKIIGVDLYIPDDLVARVRSMPFSERIELINASSIEIDTFESVKSKVGNSGSVLVHLDSNHTHEHVARELELYSDLVGKDNYLICGDTIIEYFPPQTHRDRPWGKGNNPKTALDEFMVKNKRFIVDKELENKMLYTNQPGGYLICIED